ncbi:MAG: hypothetical protein IBJ18_01390 [Phycisphaerales bacterium]|nr:hypothetical protein [Phycisphaerales bacterium]
MRIPFTKVWRAFPELDRFDDDRCKRFVKRASQAFWLVKLFRFLMHLLGIAIGGVVVGFVLQAAFVLADDWRLRSPSREIFVAAAASVTGLLAFVTLLSVRNRFLRKRIRTIINPRGTCLSCGYSLLGLPVPDSLKLPCPECGFTCEVDPSLGELSSDPAGRATFTPRSDLIAQRVFWTPKRRRVATWSAVALVVLTGAGVGLSLWIKERRINADIAQARADLPIRPSLQDIYNRSLPADRQVGETRMIDQLVAMSKLIADAEAAVLQSETPVKNDIGNKVDDFGYDALDPVENERSVLLLDESRQQDARKEVGWRAENANRVLAILQRTQFKVIAASCAAGLNWAVEYPEDETERLGFGRLSNVRTQVLSWIANANQRLAWERNEAEAFQIWCRFVRELTKFSAQNLGTLDRRIAFAVPAHQITLHMRMLESHVEAPWLDIIAEFWQPLDNLQVSVFIEGQHTVLRHHIASFFANKERLKQGVFGSSRPIGTYTQNLTTAKHLYESAIAASQVPAWTRSPLDSKAQSESYAIIALHAPSMLNEVKSFELHEQSRQTILTMIALERHRLAHGQYPDQLADLPKDALANLPVDLATGLPAAYRRIDPKLDPKHRGYLLYLLGPDREDNAGNDYMPDTFLYAIPKNSIPKGSDIVLNGRPW